MKKTALFIGLLVFLLCQHGLATTYYINSSMGDDSHLGTHQNQAFKTVAPINKGILLQGDSVLFASGERFVGMLQLINLKGNKEQPIVIGSYRYKGNTAKPILDAGQDLNAILIRNASFIQVMGLEITGTVPIQNDTAAKKDAMRCGILVELTNNDAYQNIVLSQLLVHDVYYNTPGFIRSKAEVASANGTQAYGWGIRFINNSAAGQLNNLQVLHTEIYKVSHTGLKFTAKTDGIKELVVADCLVHHTGGPGMQLSGVSNAHFIRNKIHHSGSTDDSRNWGRGSGLWTWGCKNILIEHNRFEDANGPGDSAGIHIDFNCSDVIVQYNFSANNAGGFCEILGNNYNCAYRYNISVNDGFRVKGQNGAFQEGKIFWLSGYQGNDKKKFGPFNSYFYNNTIYVAANIAPRVAISNSANGVLIANNVFYFESAALLVADDQKKQAMDQLAIPNVLFSNNLYLRPDNWPVDASIKDSAPLFGDPGFRKKGGLDLKDYLPQQTQLIKNKGMRIEAIPNDPIGLRLGLMLAKDILGNPIVGAPDLGAIELR